MSRILVIQLRQLGDMLQTTPMIRQLGRLYPQTPIDLVCEPRSDVVVRHNRRLAEIFHLPRSIGVLGFLNLARQLRRRKYELVVDSQALPKTAILTRFTGAARRLGFRRRWLRNRLCYTDPYSVRQPVAEYSALTKLRLLQDSRVDATDLRLDFPIGPEDQEAADRFRATHFCPPVVAINAVSHRADNRWSIQKSAETADRLAAEGFQPFLLFGPGEQPAAREVASAMRSPALVDYPMLSLAVLKGVLEGCALFVGSDGGPKHAAVAAGLPTVALFDKMHPEVWTEPFRSDQRFVATHPRMRSLPTRGKCTDAETLADVPLEAVWEEIESLFCDGYVRHAVWAGGVRRMRRHRQRRSLLTPACGRLTEVALLG